jgi:hypothetical protein
MMREAPKRMYLRQRTRDSLTRPDEDDDSSLLVPACGVLEGPADSYFLIVRLIEYYSS